MSFKNIAMLPTPNLISAELPVREDLHHVEHHRRNIQNILSGQNQRTLAIIGPCSAWPFDAVEIYSHRLKRTAEDIQSRVQIVMRSYIQKPRTIMGWEGPLIRPDPLGDPNITEGIWKCRRMMSNAAKLHPLADEMLFTHNNGHFEGLVSYVAVGARSAEDMEHRYMASGLDAPVGIKNGTDGNLRVAANGVQCAQSPHDLALHDYHVQTSGNPYAHLVLRGGESKPNYDAESIALAAQLLTDAKVKNPAIIIDTNHDNSRKRHERQPEIVGDVLKGMRERKPGYDLVRGFMIESFMLSGNQKISADMNLAGLSITDPCLGIDETEVLLRRIADAQDARI